MSTTQKISRDFTVVIHADNSAFEQDEGVEVARILRDIARRVEQGDDFTLQRALHDLNGNDAGRAGWRHAR